MQVIYDVLVIAMLTVLISTVFIVVFTILGVAGMYMYEWIMERIGENTDAASYN